MSSESDWPTFAHDAERTSTQPNSPYNAQNAATLKLNWTFTDGTEFIASPIVYGGVVYVVDEDGQMTALSATNGSILWQKQLGLWVEQTPAVLDGLLFVGNHDIPSNLYALNPSNGTLLWTTIVPGGLKGSPVALNGTLYEGLALGDPGFCSPGGVYSFNEMTGQPGATWLTEASGISDGGAVWSPISTDGTELYFGTGNTCENGTVSANAFMSIEPTTMAQRWSDQTASALIDDDDGSGIGLYPPYGVTAGKNGQLYWTNLATGTIVWSATLGSPDGFGPVSTPVVANNVIVTSNGLFSVTNSSGVAADGGGLSGYSKTGTRLWLIKTATEVRSIAATNGIAFAALDNSVNAIDPTTGKLLWTSATTGDFANSPAVTSSGIFAADLSGTVYAYALPSQLSSDANAIASRSKLRAAVLGKTAFIERRRCVTGSKS